LSFWVFSQWRNKYKEVVALDDEQAIVALLKAHGVSDKDIKSLSNRELSDDELDSVNGGISLERLTQAFSTILRNIGILHPKKISIPIDGTPPTVEY